MARSVCNSPEKQNDLTSAHLIRFTYDDGNKIKMSYFDSGRFLVEKMKQI